ncbi:tetratricopeptide repeat protein [Lederbergia panacisoli]|uniref:tetratricopeptide repeat protein n=1 Tax=Lederbergia panacisoli TaxID=1255251 RepID=UPI00214CF929|nr:tetratricopeptide repeat protein [Lederbergia panacisoli]MCR2821420.1 tetratricopeptide repeat protein [Lederbergia panacisoli]
MEKAIKNKVRKVKKVIKRIIPRNMMKIAMKCYVKFHKKLASYAINKKKWKMAVKHFHYIYKSHPKKLSANDFLHYYEALQKENQNKKAMAVLEKAVKLYPKNKKVIILLSDLYIKKKEWKKAAALLIKLLEMNNKNIPIKVYTNLATAYRHLKLIDRAVYVLQEGIRQNPESLKLLNQYLNILIEQNEWQSSIDIFEYILKLRTEKPTLDDLLQLSMFYQIVGNHEKGNEIFEELQSSYSDDIQKDELGYRKLVLLDNGESRIEFYKNLQKTNKVILTFDSISVLWDQPSFGFKLLHSQGYDIIAVRKKRKDSYYQDLSLENYVDAVSSLVDGYSDKVAYGYSIGAYAVLYYTSKLNCRILAISPRLSVHPLYGKKGKIKKHKLLHSVSHYYNADINPVILYDPHNGQDNKYIHKGLLPFYPNAQLLEIPYAGHGIAPYFLQIGILKDFVLSFVKDGQVMKYDKSLKVNSGIYYWNLGRWCLRHNKLRWANDLSKKALLLGPTDKYAVKLRIDILFKLGKYDEAIEFVAKTSELDPNNIEIRKFMIDVYIEKKDLILAEKELKNLIEIFGEKPVLKGRGKNIEKARKLLIQDNVNPIENIG